MRDVTVSSPAGSDLHYAMLYTHGEVREKLELINAIKSELENIPLTVSDKGVARIKLDWWRVETDRLNNGAPTHRLTKACNSLAMNDSDFCDAMQMLVAGLDEELGNQAKETRNEQLAWYEQVYGPMYRVQAEIQDNTHCEAHPLAKGLGVSVERAYSLLNLKHHALHGIKRISNECLNEANCDWADILANERADGVVRLLSKESNSLVNDIRALHENTNRAIRRRHLSIYTLSNIALRTLQEMQYDGFRIWRHQIHLTPIRKLWLAWRARFI